MSTPVARTCTEMPPRGAHNIEASNPMPLKAYRSKPAYVLLGDPGSGKTTEFEQECDALGDAAMYVTARSFAANVYSDWQLVDKTLFIDGLDEMRAGTTDARVPLDDIRRRLVELGRPSFRISCREADWLGPNDRRSLEEVSPDSAITVLLLDELSEHATCELLTEVGVDDAETFEEEARRRGLGAMLGNPHALTLLTDAVGQGDNWPESRLEALELACIKMATEHNDEHLAVEPTHPTEAILDAAGHLGALLLLCGFEGFTLALRDAEAGSGTDGFVSLDDLGEEASGHSPELLRAALSTKLFKPDGETELVTRHRQVAEFLTGRYLAKRIRNGLPARRVVALMTSPSEGRAVTALRGLSAWLAAHPGEARRLLIDADPVGVGLYGDLRGFTRDDRECLFGSLVEFAEQGPLLGHAWQDGRADRYRDDTAWAFRSLASADMLESIRSLLNSPTENAQRDRTAEFVLEVLSNAEASEKQSLAALEPDLMKILRDADRPPWVRKRSLDAYVHIRPSSDAERPLVELLDAIHAGSIPDPDDRLREALLKHLYPEVIGPAGVWRYALPRPRHAGVSRVGGFWDHTIVKKSSDPHIAELVDALSEDAARLIPALAKSDLDDLPVQLLARGLSAVGDSLEAEHLLDWLEVAGRRQDRLPSGEEATGDVRQWLESRPHVQQAVFLAWLRREVTREPDSPRRHWFCDALYGSKLPANFGLWCLEQAIALEDSEPALAQELLSQSYVALADPSIREGLTLADMRDGARTGVLARKLEELHSRQSAGGAQDNKSRQRIKKHRRERAEKVRRRREEWAKGLRPELDDLRSNKLFPPNLHTLAQVYLGMLADVDHEASSRQRIRDFIGDDKVLVEAVMAAIRGAISRDDVPGVNETVSLHSESKHSWLAYPVLASLHLLNEEDPHGLDRIDDDRKRSALAIRHCVPSGETAQPWHERWFRQQPELVLEVLFRCALPAVRSGEEFVSCLNTLDSLGGHDNAVPDLAFDESTGLFEARSPEPRFDGHDELIHAVRLRLLDAIPTRASNKQMGLVDNLLARAIRHPDTVSLHELAARKLSLNSMGVAQRVRWLTVDALLSAGPSLQSVKRYIRVKNTEVRVRHLAEFLRRTSRNDDMRRSVLADVREPEVLRDAIEILGPSFGPVQWGGGYVTLGMEMSDLLGTLIEQLGTIAGDDADRAFTELTNDPRMARWRDRLTWAHERQRVVNRDASYRHPSIDEVQRTLNNGVPACAADLAALLQDRIADVSADLRGGNDDPWQEYWNVDQHGRPTDARPENVCRNALVRDLRSRLRGSVTLDPEARYAAETRADIRASCSGFNVPVEIKKNSHRDLWSALRRQLIDKYTASRATSGYGIYLVLWFGANETKTPPDGKRPNTPEELRQRLARELTPDEARKISVIVLDVTKPGADAAGAVFKRTTDSASGQPGWNSGDARLQR